MKYYLACSGMMLEVPDWGFLRERFEKTHFELRSYWELTEFTGHTLPVYGNDFILDSGAFSARTQGFEIDVEVYGRFVARYKDQIAHIANLDVIPNDLSVEGLNAAAKASYKNQLRLEEMTGKKPLPVYHKGEPIEWLHKYLDEYEYTCIGGLANENMTNVDFFDLVWDENFKYAKRQASIHGGSVESHLRKFHAFGLSAFATLQQYPWYSADSSSWLVTSKLGMIIIPQMVNGAYDYLRRPESFAVSEKSSAKKFLYEHYETLPQYQKEHVDGYLKHLDVDIQKVSTEACWRMAVNMEFWRRFGEATEKRPPVEQKRQISLL